MTTSFRSGSLLALAMAVILGGCQTAPGVVVATSSKAAQSADAGGGAAPAAGGGTGASGSRLPAWMGGSEPVAAPRTRDGKPIVPSIRSQLQCKTPPENYDFTGVITARYGTAAALRLQRLLATDFADSSITKKDREMLRFMAREMLWIPVQVEEAIGAALLAASGSELAVLAQDAANKELWEQTTVVIQELSAAAPANPFQTRLILLKKGQPGSLAGGVIFVDNTLLKSVFDVDPPSLGKMRFVIAHELAHIHRRHRAKRIQQLLVDSNAGLKLTRQIIARAQAGGSGFTPEAIGQWLQTASAVQQVAKELMQHHKKYEQDQEFEADACAAALMIDAGAGDPLLAFKAYRVDVDKQAALAARAGSASAASSLMADTHPPDAVREARIKEKVLEYRVGDKTTGTREAAFNPSRAASAVGGDNRGRAVAGALPALPTAPTAAGASTTRAGSGAATTRPAGAASAAGSGRAAR